MYINGDFELPVVSDFQLLQFSSFNYVLFSVKYEKTVTFGAVLKFFSSHGSCSGRVCCFFSHHIHEEGEGDG